MNKTPTGRIPGAIMKKGNKVTSKNVKRIAKVVEMDLQKSMSCFSGTDSNKFAYETKKEINGSYATIYITPTRKRNAYITSAAIISVNDVFQESKWKESMFYGIEIRNSYDKDSKSWIPLPCISVTISIEQEDEQQG